MAIRTSVRNLTDQEGAVRTSDWNLRETEGML